MSYNESWKLTNTAELLQQIAAYVWVKEGDDHKGLYEKITGARIASELYDRLTSNPLLDTYRAQCLANIAEFVKANPRATEAELTAAVQKHISQFKDQVNSL